ncbi:glycoside hydrolase family 128 protein [Xylariaceae sp. FL0016]|nr:glycoside hydrolase family 128 protein [Xylariaceae sp. FL0016]
MLIRKLRLSSALACALAGRSTAQDDASPKRGLSYVGDTHAADYDILLSSNSPLSWYYNWSPYPVSSDIFQADIEFVPTLHGTDSLDGDIQQLDNLDDSSKHLFTFNEPDGTTSSGGSSIEPQDAAKAYIEQIVPLRDRFQISHPSVTGSSRGLQWLDDFNSSCWEIDSESGCPADFVTAHWYGDFAGLSSWLGQLAGWYNKSGSGLDGDLQVWISELALVQASDDTTFAMMNQTLPYLDSLDYVAKYSWFGAFRPNEANDWTGDGVSLFQNDGGLSQLGAYYLGGQANGFDEGDKGNGANGNGTDDSGDTNDGDDNGTDDDANAGTGPGISAAAIYIVAAMGCAWNVWIM